jgi:hypothetical protein
MGKSGSPKKRKKIRKILPWWAPFKANTCAACGEWANMKRRVRWCCLTCRKMSIPKFEAACDEWDRIKEAARLEHEQAKRGEAGRRAG